MLFLKMLQAKARLKFCREHDRPREALGSLWESLNMDLLRCERAARRGMSKMVCSQAMLPFLNTLL